MSIPAFWARRLVFPPYSVGSGENCPSSNRPIALGFTVLKGWISLSIEAAGLPYTALKALCNA
ncbi:MAG TPA: hypothetical protein VL087_02225 [Nitrospirota bacterium]|nr:hypothetical protein [Nitrospirota bacterium]